MKENAHILRKSQYILKYGPGSLIETNYETRLILNLQLGLAGSVGFSESRLKKYEISDPRLLSLLGNKNRTRILDIPTNEILNKGTMDVIYKTKRFPRWYICHGIHGTHEWKNKTIKSVLFRPNSKNDYSCPICHTRMNKCTSVRFVMACTNGHLDDVNWFIALHGDLNSCTRKTIEEEFYIWSAKSTNLASIKIKCPYCNNANSMLNIFYRKFNCTGLYQERFDGNKGFRDDCNSEMRVIQKNSSALRLPEIINFLIIPKYYTQIGRLFYEDKNTISMIFNLIRSAFEHIPDPETKKNTIISTINNNYEKTNKDEIIEYIKEREASQISEEVVMLFESEKNFIDFINEEYETLRGSPFKSEYFEKMNFREIEHNIDGFPGLKICKINILQTITVQKGYRRVPYTIDNNLIRKKKMSVDIGEQIGGDIWYPAFRSFGEGIFITFIEGDEDFVKDKSKIINRKNFVKTLQNGIGLDDEAKLTVKSWKKESEEFNLDSEGPDSIVNWSSINREPLFVWLHTLSHSLIKNISTFAGYNSAALRERIYVKKNENGEVVNGGILIYITSPGSDGGMGGLTKMADHFSEILEDSIESITFCSNDPLCDLKEKDENSKNGSGCHSCLLISETSCEHRNYYLDRHLITKLQ